MGNEQSEEVKAHVTTIEKTSSREDLDEIEEEQCSEEEEAMGKKQTCSTKHPPLCRSASTPDPEPPVRKSTLLNKATEFRRNSGLETRETICDITKKSKPKCKKQKKVDCIEEHNDNDIHQEQHHHQHHHQYYEVSHRGQTIKDGAMFCESSNLEMWEKIFKDSLMGSNFFYKAAIVNLFTGGVLVCSPPEFMPLVEQVKSLAVAFHNPSSLAATGIMVADDQFQYETGRVGSVLFGIAENGDHKLMVKAGKQNALMVVYHIKKREEAIKLVEELCQYFSEGYSF